MAFQQLALKEPTLHEKALQVRRTRHLRQLRDYLGVHNFFGIQAPTWTVTTDERVARFARTAAVAPTFALLSH